MKTNLLILICIIGFGYLAAAFFNDHMMPQSKDPGAPSELKIGQKIPRFSFKSFDGRYFTVSDAPENKILVINFWASWCPPCREEFPRLIKTVNKHKDVLLLAPSSDLDEKTAYEYIEKLEMETGKTLIKNPNMFIGIDPNQRITNSIFYSFKLPETWIIDSNMRVRKKLIGASWTEEELERIIQKLKQTPKE